MSKSPEHPRTHSTDNHRDQVHFYVPIRLEGAEAEAANDESKLENAKHVADRQALSDGAVAMDPQSRAIFILDSQPLNYPHPYIEAECEDLEYDFARARKAATGKWMEYSVTNSPNGKIVYIATGRAR